MLQNQVQYKDKAAYFFAPYLALRITFRFPTCEKSACAVKSALLFLVKRALKKHRLFLTNASYITVCSRSIPSSCDDAGIKTDASLIFFDR